MKIVINETGKFYWLAMTTWTGSDWNGPDESVDTFSGDESFKWDEDADAYRVEGTLKSLEDFLKDWENYETDADAEAHDKEELEQLREDYPRYYDLSEIEVRGC